MECGGGSTCLHKFCGNRQKLGVYQCFIMLWNDSPRYNFSLFLHALFKHEFLCTHSHKFVLGLDFDPAWYFFSPVRVTTVCKLCSHRFSRTAINILPCNSCFFLIFIQVFYIWRIQSNIFQHQVLGSINQSISPLIPIVLVSASKVSWSPSHPICYWAQVKSVTHQL